MQTESLKVTGMTCDGCTAKVAKALKALDGVKEVVVSLSSASAMVRFDERLASPAQLKSAVERAGYSVGADGTARSHRAKGGCCG
ncbi:MAG TPA: heavy-metal-associated domain-containing protein [Steroidobacteraceae bacterium]|nr:heavy-metal-associated domain-containing protein [Steroidobacteraceae bacterium]